MKKEKLTVETGERGTVTYSNASGRLHNPNGPAMVYADGHEKYYINDNKLTEADFKAWQAQQTTK